MDLGNALLNFLLSLSLVLGSGGTPPNPRNINLSVAPPAAQVEAVPAIPAGYLWTPGFWVWNGAQHNWVPGRLLAERAGYHWQPNRWEERNHKYYRIAGYWEPDNS